MSTLRHIDGIPLSKLERLGFCLQGPKVNHHIHHGLLIADSGCLRVAGRGWKLIDSLQSGKLHVCTRATQMGAHTA